MTVRTPPPRRDHYPWFRRIDSRWMDNDIYGHVNNVVYYSYFDTAIAHYLIGEGGLDPRNSPVIGYCVESACRYFRPLAFPHAVEVGVGVTRLGRSSVHYLLGVFRAGAEEASAAGRFVHVFVDRKTERAAPLPAALRRALARIALPSDHPLMDPDRS